jgi:hypothetical protein
MPANNDDPIHTPGRRGIAETNGLMMRRRTMRRRTMRRRTTSEHKKKIRQEWEMLG